MCIRRKSNTVVLAIVLCIVFVSAPLIIVPTIEARATYLGSASLPRAGQNDAWVYFSPTAKMQPEAHSVEVILWAKHLGQVDLVPVRLRYDMQLMEWLQFGLQLHGLSESPSAGAKGGNATKSQGVHSLFASLKYKIVSDYQWPFDIAIGLRRRLYFDRDNTDFSRVDDDQLNQLTLQAILTGSSDVAGLLYSVYLDNLSAAAGIKLFLLPEVKAFAETIWHYYEDPYARFDHAVGVQYVGDSGSLTACYQIAPKQAQLGFSVDF